MAELRSRIGAEHRSSEPPHIEVATKDAIRHFAWGIGDSNPLWTDEEYARKSKWGCLLAPPCILYAMDRGASGHLGGGLPGIHAMFSGTDWEWFLPIRVGDRITCTGHLSDVVEKKGQFSRRMVHQGFQVLFRNQQGETVAQAKMWALRTERGTARERGKYAEITQHVYTPEEVQAIEADYDREVVRGAQPRYWEDVAEGEELALVVKGPLTITDIICFKIGWGGSPFVRAHGLALAWRRRHPGVALPNRFGIPDVPERVHWEDDMAREVGVPAAYDYGPQRISWISNLLTHWMGDDGFLRKLSVQVRRFNLLGDTTWCRGKVVGKSREGGEALVECRVWAENQRKEITAIGQATVRLPTKGG
ncbi:MAG: MaoC family dehydratase N-terminal domain-containing protein [Chloroflexota bacterium]|nr:MaoC family dehydratase N-terminal domain-containing protein [Chloroflexota bacterium]